MTHPVIENLNFTRSESLRGLEGVSEEDGARHFGQMNCISWIVGYLAWQEQRYFLIRTQGTLLRPDIQERFFSGAPMSTPSLAEMLRAWREITAASAPFAEALTTERLLADLPLDGRSVGQSLGSALRRLMYHYWFHIGEILAIRQMLGQKQLPEYVGNLEAEASYRPETVEASATART